MLKNPWLYLFELTFGFIHKGIRFTAAADQLLLVTKPLSWMISRSQFDSLSWSAAVLRNVMISSLSQRILDVRKRAR